MTNPLSRVRRADVFGVLFVVALSALTILFVLVLLHAPLVLLSVLGVVAALFAGHLIADELEDRWRRWEARHDLSDPAPAEPLADPVDVGTWLEDLS